MKISRKRQLFLTCKITLDNKLLFLFNVIIIKQKCWKSKSIQREVSKVQWERKKHKKVQENSVPSFWYEWLFLTGLCSEAAYTMPYTKVSKWSSFLKWWSCFNRGTKLIMYTSAYLIYSISLSNAEHSCSNNLASVCFTYSPANVTLCRKW